MEVDGRIYARGAAGQKGGLAAALAAVRALQDSAIALDYDLQLQFVIGGETGGLGTISAILSNPPIDAVIILDPTDMQVARAQSGHLKFTLEIEGRNALTAIPWEGVSAFEKIVLAYDALQRLADSRSESMHHALFDSWPSKAPFAVGRIRAGDYPWSIPAWAAADGRFGILPGESPDHAKAAMEDALAELAGHDSWLRVHPPRLKWAHGVFAPWETPADAPLVKALLEGLEKVRGRSEPIGLTFGTDGSHFSELLDASVAVFGPGAPAETSCPDESVAVEDVLDAAKVLACAIASWNGIS